MRRLFVKRISKKRTAGKRRYHLVAAIIVLCWMMAQSIVGTRAEAADKGTVSSGSISADNGAVVFYSTDVDYLRQEADSLHSEMDYSEFDLTEVSGTVIISGSRRNLLDSHGIISYGKDKVTADANDLLDLADQIDTLENYCASAVYRALNTIGTYLDKEGAVYHEPLTAGSLVLTGFEQLAGGICQSQSVTHLESSPVMSDNITAGAAAWVNGQCVIGNGADNDRAYQRGVEDGESGNNKGVDIRYTYHTHTGDSGIDPIPDGHVCYLTGNPGGCYRNGGHTHNIAGACKMKEVIKKRMCGCTRIYDAAVENCPQCGHWHGGGGTCEFDVITTSMAYDCGNPVNTWIVNCGRKAGQTESAEVIIHKNKNADEWAWGGEMYEEQQ